MSSLIAQFDVNPKLFHAYINHRILGHLTAETLVTSDGKACDNKLSEVFADSLSSVFNVSFALPAAHQTSGASLTDINITVSNVRDVLKSTDSTFSADPGGIHPHLLKMC